MGTTTGPPRYDSAQELQWMTRLTHEHDNLCAAILWGLKNDIERALELVCDLTLYWSRGGHNEEVIGWLRLALSNPMLSEAQSAPLKHVDLNARAHLNLGILSLQQEDPQAPSTLHEAESLLRQSGSKADLAVALAFLGFLGDLHAAQESVDIARTTQDKWILAYCLVWQSQALRVADGDLQLARRAAGEGARLSREIGRPVHVHIGVYRLCSSAAGSSVNSWLSFTLTFPINFCCCLSTSKTQCDFNFKYNPGRPPP